MLPNKGECALMGESIRTPQQKRSIDKKNRIIEAGYELFARDGYFNTNTAQIAKHAGVSTGIVYGYFRDKRDILLEVLSIYVDKVFNPIMEIFDNLETPLDFESLLSTIIDSTIEIHKHNASIHEALHSLSSSDEAVGNKFLGIRSIVCAGTQPTISLPLSTSTSTQSLIVSSSIFTLRPS